MTGYSSEEYLLATGDRRVQHEFAIVQVSPVGAGRATLGDTARTVIRITMRLRSLGDRRLTLDGTSIRLSVAASENRSFRAVSPERVVGRLEAAPHQEETLDIFFALPPEVAPRDLEGLELTWMVHAGPDAYMTATPIAQRFVPGSNAVSFYVVPGAHPLLFPVERRWVVPRQEAHRTTVVF